MHTKYVELNFLTLISYLNEPQPAGTSCFGEPGGAIRPSKPPGYLWHPAARQDPGTRHNSNNKYQGNIRATRVFASFCVRAMPSPSGEPWQAPAGERFASWARAFGDTLAPTPPDACR